MCAYVRLVDSNHVHRIFMCIESLSAHSETLGSEPHGIERGICIFSIISGWC